jgi:hypothetical protein
MILPLPKNLIKPAIGGKNIFFIIAKLIRDKII